MDTLVQRLETRDSTIVGRTESVPACIAAFGQILNAAAAEDADKIDEAVADLGRNLVGLETVVLRLQGELSRCEKEEADISEVQTAIEAAVSDTQSDIESLKTQLSDARQRRSNLLQYEGLAKNVNKHPDRPQLRKRQREAEEQLQHARDESAEVEAKLAERRQQFSLLMTTITDLENMYALEDSQAAAAAAASSTQQQAEEGELTEEGSSRASADAGDGAASAAGSDSTDADGDTKLD